MNHAPKLWLGQVAERIARARAQRQQDWNDGNRLRDAVKLLKADVRVAERRADLAKAQSARTCKVLADPVAPK
jgi:hypothetical protein